MTRRGLGDVRSVLGIAKTRIAIGNAIGRLGDVLHGRPVVTQKPCPNCGNHNDATALACRRCGTELIV
jgi:hypothetical protein